MVKAFAGLILATFAGLALRGLYLQGFRSAECQKELLERRRHVFAVHPPRGRILDRRGRVLAEDKRSFDLYVELDEFERGGLGMDGLGRLIASPQAELHRSFEKLYRDVDHVVERALPRKRDQARRGELRAPRLLRRNIPSEAAIQIALGSEAHRGLVAREVPRRTYPMGRTAAHLLGYLGSVRPEELGSLESYFEPLGDTGAGPIKRRVDQGAIMIGRTGIEKGFDARLRGGCGLAFGERDSKTRMRRVTDIVAARPGEDVKLTLDLEAQKIVESALAADGFEREAAVVVDAETGALLAMASKPTFDPNALIPPVDEGVLAGYFDPNGPAPLLNRAASGLYPLGSIFKIVSAYAALSGRAVTPSEIIECRGKSSERSDAFRCWIYKQSRGVHGPLRLAEALEQSCNCYFFELGRRMTLAQVEEAALLFGLGKPTGLPIPERRGRLPSYGRPAAWRQTDTMALSIGQGSLLVTPVQVAALMTTVANGGRRLPLWLAEAGEPAEEAADPGLVRAIHHGLVRVVSGPRGTAKDAGLARFQTAGKTSSAQIGRDEAHAWFAGYAPSDKPKYVVVTLVEKGLAGGHAAAPVAAKILEKLFAAAE